MLKDLIQKSYRKLKKEDDNIPLGIRGELEVIVRDKNKQVISYQKDHNEITQWMKHAIVHLLAGDTLTTEYTRQIGSTGVYTYSTMQANGGTTFHTNASVNLDGLLLSDKPYFHAGLGDTTFSWRNFDPKAGSENFRTPFYPTKMLFGTGKEIKADASWATDIEGYYGSNPTILSNFLGENVNSTNFTQNIDNATNYYSNTLNFAGTALEQTRTIQPNSTNQITGDISANETGITGAIKNCLITDTASQTENYDFTTTFMAKGLYRGVGRPCFLYAQRLPANFATSSIIPGFTHISQEDASVYEDKFTYSVIMPQNSSNSFYPYNGWILREAGLFTDSVLRIKDGPPNFAMPVGVMLAKRYITPVIKTPDVEIEMRWSIFISDTAN